jgi:hypothetical protein
VFTPPQMPGQSYGGDEPPAKGNRGRTFAIIGAVVVLAGAAGGTYMLTKGSGGSPKSKPTAAPTATATASTPETPGNSSFPDNSYTSSRGGTAPPSAASAPGGATLDSATTDKTPFTQAGMVASTFTDAKNVAYSLKTSSIKTCDKVGDAAVETIVKSATCTQFMAASWTDTDNRIIVSAMIIPYQDAATASKVYDKLGSAHTGDYNQWCPPSGQTGADTCTKLAKAGNVSREGKFGSFHRYVLITTAVYTDLRTDNTQKDWLTAAAYAAFQNTLPGQ